MSAYFMAVLMFRAAKSYLNLHHPGRVVRLPRKPGSCPPIRAGDPGPPRTSVSFQNTVLRAVRRRSVSSLFSSTASVYPLPHCL